MSATLLSIAGGFIAVIGIVARVLFYVQGRKNANAAVNEDKAERLSNRPRTTDDVRDRLRKWRENQS